MKNLCNLLIVAELQIIIKAVFAKLFRMLALLLTLCANKVCNTQSETFNDTKITSSTRRSQRNGIHELLNLNSAAISNETIGSTFSSTLYLNVTQFYREFFTGLWPSPMFIHFCLIVCHTGRFIVSLTNFKF